MGTKELRSRILSGLLIGIAFIGLMHIILNKPKYLTMHPSIESETFWGNTRKKLAASTITDQDILVSERDSDAHSIGSLPPSLVDYILRDKDHRISDLFQIPDELRNRVEFWFKIYSTYTIANAVIHDNAHPWIVYEVINLNSIYDLYKSASERNAAKARIIRTARYKYIDILDRLSKERALIRLSPEEKRVYHLFDQVNGARGDLFLHAKKEVRLQLGQKDSVLYAIKKSGRYLKEMEKIFENQNLPIELTRIPFLESSFNLEAHSKDGASGIWQFMSKTGKIFLRVSHAEGIDERNHPLKATLAASHLLKQNFQTLKDWPLAVTAYNHGPGGILKAISKIKSRNLGQIIEKYNDNYFGFASKNFYSEFLAMLYVEKYQNKLFGDIDKETPLEHDDIEIKYAMRVKFIMELLRISKKEIILYNPDLRKKTLDSLTYLPEGYYLKIPKEKKGPLLDFYQEVEETNKILDQLIGKDKSRDS